MTARERLPALATFCLAFFSGILAVGIEVLWTRHLLNLFGSTTTATASMLAAFMAGMALGAGAMGRVSVAARRPLLIYAGIEIGLGAYGLAIGGIVEGAAATLPAGPVSGPWGLSLTLPLRVLGHLTILLLPTTLMGATLPALAAALQQQGASRPRHLAQLYGLNVLGGAIGGLGAGFALLPLLGLARSQLGFSLAAVCLAAAATALDRPIRLRRPVTEGAPAPAPPRAPAVAPWALRGAVFLSGFAALGYEVLWTRILVLAIGSSTYAFTLMLGTYLLGLALGGLWIGRYIDRLRDPPSALRHLQLAVALAAIAGTVYFGLLPKVALAGLATFGTSAAAIAMVDASVAAALVLVPTFFIGAGFPIAARLMQGHRVERGREIGTALAWVSAGHVLGVLVTAFVLVPAAGLQGGVALLAAVNAAAALVLWRGSSATATRVSLATPAAAAGLLALGWAVPSWDTNLMTSGVYRQAPIYLNLLGTWRRLERAFALQRTLFYREGREAVVAVTERPTLSGRPHLVLTIDGKVDASNGADMSTQVLSGHLPLLFRTEAESALVIGLASGVTVGALAQHPIRRIDVVEIEAAVVPASRAFDGESHAPLTDPRVKLVIEDGRQYLRSGAESYDIIVSEPSNPWLSASARLFTREFFALARRRLAPRGVLVQWVPLYGLSEPQFRALLRTLLDVFADTAIFRVAEGDLIVVAATQPLEFNASAVLQLFDHPPSAADLGRVGIETAADLVAMWLADDVGLRATLGEGPINTDDNGLIEFGSPWYLLRDTKAANLAVLRTATARSTVASRLASAWLSMGDGQERLLTIARRHLRDGDPQIARGLAEALRSRGFAAEADMLLAEDAALRGDSATAGQLWRRHNRPDAWLGLGTLAFKDGRLAEAAAQFARAGASRRSPEQRLYHALALTSLGDHPGALAVLREAPPGDSSPATVVAPLLRAHLLARLGRREDSAIEREAFQRALRDLRHCLEREGCERDLDRLLVWLAGAEDALPEAVRDDLRGAMEASITSPMATYYRGVRQLWLGEYRSAVVSFESYLALLPGENSRSKAHPLIDLAREALGGTRRVSDPK